MTGLGTAALVIGANLPDVDALVMLTSGDMLVARRGWTHGPIGLVVLPLLLTAVLVAIDNLQLKRNTRPLDRAEVRPRQLLLLAFVGALTHPLLDWLNTYGVRLLMPFSERWFYGDALQIIDPWVWLALGLGWFVSRRRRRKQQPAATRPARTALVLVTAYSLAMAAASRSARNAAAEHLVLAGEAKPQRVLAGPVFVNSFRRHLILDYGDAYLFGTVALGPRLTVRIAPEELPTNLDHPLVHAARDSAAIRGFRYWSRFPYFIVHGDTAGLVEVRDARFRGDRPGRNPFRRLVPVAGVSGDTSPPAQ